MANRSDHTSPLPRKLKRMITLMHLGEDAHRIGVVRRLFIGAHAHALKVEPMLPLHKNAEIVDEDEQKALEKANQLGATVPA